MPTPALLTKEIERTLPPIRSGDNVARVKYFTPWSNWTWYAAEASAELEDGSEVALSDPRAKDRVDVVFWGLVFGLEKEYGYWCLSELAKVRGPMGMTIERDFYFVPTSLDQCPDPTGRHH
ncbi:MAG TPA: DUF2958 domain-containing protein [Dehalococcoidia bacterium]|nr:DUF2958 domain-containing protein [Dehalococcoidia bacterium]